MQREPGVRAAQGTHRRGARVTSAQYHVDFEPTRRGLGECRDRDLGQVERVGAAHRDHHPAYHTLAHGDPAPRLEELAAQQRMTRAEQQLAAAGNASGIAGGGGGVVILIEQQVAVVFARQVVDRENLGRDAAQRTFPVLAERVVVDDQHFEGGCAECLARGRRVRRLAHRRGR